MSTPDEDLIETVTAYVDARIDDDATRAAMALSLLPAGDPLDRSFALACGLAHLVLERCPVCPDCGGREFVVLADPSERGVPEAVEVMTTLAANDRAAARLFVSTLEVPLLGQAIKHIATWAIAVRVAFRESGGAS